MRKVALFIAIALITTFVVKVSFDSGYVSGFNQGTHDQKTVDDAVKEVDRLRPYKIEPNDVNPRIRI